jgi:2-polyprenyl-3-methyl-5-hydroxy-6-metoxy-1,4-benzoquinol methylase
MWDQRYNTTDYVYGTRPNDFLADVAAQIPKGRVLCIAEGEGRNAVYLAELGYEVIAVDVSAVGMQKAQKLALERGVSIETVVADLADFEIEENSFNAVISIFAHVPPAIRGPLHRKIVNGLKPGGMLVLEAYTPDQIAYGTGGPPVAELTMSLRVLEDELQGLEFRHAVELKRDVIEGSLHTGTGAVVQVIAVRR